MAEKRDSGGRGKGSGIKKCVRGVEKGRDLSRQSPTSTRDEVISTAPSVASLPVNLSSVTLHACVHKCRACLVKCVSASLSDSVPACLPARPPACPPPVCLPGWPSGPHHVHDLHQALHAHACEL